MSVPRSESLPVYRQAPPDEWPELVDFTHDLLKRNIPFEDKCVLVLGRVQELDVERAGVNRYYSLGIAMRGLAAALHDPSIRTPIALTAAQTTINKAQIEKGITDPKDIRVSMVHEGAFNEAAGPVLLRSRYRQTEAEQLLGDALSFCRGYERLHGAERPDMISRMCAGVPQYANLQATAFTGATELVTTLLRRIAVEQGISNPNTRLSDLTGRYSAENLCEAIPKKTIQRAASVHIEVFHAIIPALQLTKGELLLDKSNLPDPEYKFIDRTAILGCPARYIQGLMEDAVATVAESIVLTQALST